MAEVPIYVRIADNEEIAAGTVDDPNDVPGALRAMADEMDAQAGRKPVGAVIEIIEKRRQPIDPDSTYDGQIIVPNEIRINGQPLMAPADTPVRVHEVELSAHEAVLVTLTLFARRVLIGTEAPEVSDV